jgi:hypothetical protein
MINGQCKEKEECFEHGTYRAASGQCERCKEGMQVDPLNKKRCIDHACTTANCYDYRGGQTKTVSGLECRNWKAHAAEQVSSSGSQDGCADCGLPSRPNCGFGDCKKTCNWCRIKEQDYPFAGLGDHNYCRNPDPNSNQGNTMWCYAKNQQGWEYCDIVGGEGQQGNGQKKITVLEGSCKAKTGGSMFEQSN